MLASRQVVDRVQIDIALFEQFVGDDDGGKLAPLVLYRLDFGLQPQATGLLVELLQLGEEARAFRRLELATDVFRAFLNAVQMEQRLQAIAGQLLLLRAGQQGHRIALRQGLTGQQQQSPQRTAPNQR